jgi:hypothetical protein
MSRALISSFVCLLSGFMCIFLRCRKQVQLLLRLFRLRLVGLCFLLVGS